MWAFESPLSPSPSEPLHGAGVRLQNSPGHARRSVYGLGPAVHRPAGSSHPRESPVLMAQPPRYSSPAAPRDMSPGHRRERRFKRPQRYLRLRRRPQYLPRSLPESGDRARTRCAHPPTTITGRLRGRVAHTAVTQLTAIPRCGRHTRTDRWQVGRGRQGALAAMRWGCAGPVPATSVRSGGVAKLPSPS